MDPRKYLSSLDGRQADRRFLKALNLVALSFVAAIAASRRTQNSVAISVIESHPVLKSFSLELPFPLGL
jgi:hypothetical protein